MHYRSVSGHCTALHSSPLFVHPISLSFDVKRTFCCKGGTGTRECTSVESVCLERVQLCFKIVCHYSHWTHFSVRNPTVPRCGYGWALPQRAKKQTKLNLGMLSSCWNSETPDKWKFLKLHLRRLVKEPQIFCHAYAPRAIPDESNQNMRLLDSGCHIRLSHNPVAIVETIFYTSSSTSFLKCTSTCPALLEYSNLIVVWVTP
jgi:hypothetical protein